MRLWRISTVTVAVVAFGIWPLLGRAANCTTQGELQPQDRDALTAAGGRLAGAVLAQDYATLQAALLPSEASDWEGIRDSVELGAPLLKGGQSNCGTCICWMRAAQLLRPIHSFFAPIPAGR